MKQRIINIWGIIAFILVTSIFAYMQEKPKSLLIDSFTYSTSEDAEARIDFFHSQLNQSPQNAGLVIVYGGKISKKGEIEAHLRGIKHTFVFKRIDHQRIPVVSGGYREKQTVEFWIIPNGADSPSLNPTVATKNVRFKGISKKLILYNCCL